MILTAVVAFFSEEGKRQKNEREREREKDERVALKRKKVNGKKEKALYDLFLMQPGS